MYKLALLVLGTWAIECQDWKCQSLEQGVCASWTPDEVVVNTNKCPQGKTCSFVDLVVQTTWNRWGQTYCEEDLTPRKSPSVNCNLPSTKSFVPRQNPLECETDYDCMIPSVTKRICTCATNSKAYCPLFKDDKELLYYRENCQNLSPEESYYWHLYITMYPYLQEVSPCIKGAFHEFEVIEYLNLI